MEYLPLPQVPIVPNLARDQEQFVQALVAELRGHQLLSDRSYKALIGRVDELTEDQLVALLQAMGVWPDTPGHANGDETRLLHS